MFMVEQNNLKYFWESRVRGEKNMKNGDNEEVKKLEWVDDQI